MAQERVDGNEQHDVWSKTSGQDALVLFTKTSRARIEPCESSPLKQADFLLLVPFVCAVESPSVSHGACFEKGAL